MTPQRPPLIRLPWLALGLLALLAAMWAGLIRMGWALPPLQPGWIGNHGPLMISGFLGTVICLERAAALATLGRTRWPYLAPALAGLGALAALLGLPPQVSRGLALLGSLGLTAIFGAILRQRNDAAHQLMGAGALLWLAGNSLWWLGRPDSQAVLWWAGFLVLTIAGERLELARLLRLSRPAFGLLLASLGAILAGLGLSLWVYDAGFWLSGLGLAALGMWLLRYDLARRTLRQTGLPRFVALCLLPGYVWLAVAGALWVLFAQHPTAGPVYDALLHSLLLGFVISMIFGHAPIIFPALLNRPIRYQPTFYVHLVLLHLGLILRLAGDLGGQMDLRRWGGLLNVTAVVVFLGVTVGALMGESNPPSG